MSYEISATFNQMVILRDKLGECSGALFKLARTDHRLPRKGDLQDLFDVWSIRTKWLPDGRLQLLGVAGTALPNDASVLFKTIAPFVDTSSWPEPPTIECHGEEGQMWRYLFSDGQVYHQHPRITWVND